MYMEDSGTMDFRCGIKEKDIENFCDRILEVLGDGILYNRPQWNDTQN